MKWHDPNQIEQEYRAGVSYKDGLGTRGLYEQNKINERFMVGDQWHGAKCGSDRPLVRHNVIKRIGDYKMAVVGSNPIAVNYTADGVPATIGLKDRVQRIRDAAAQSETLLERSAVFDTDVPTTEEINIVTAELSGYFDFTAERVKLQDLKEQVLRDAYVTGTGILYTYWDESIRTGLYANESHTAPITGDIACEVLDVENVYFGDPSVTDVQKQPYILIAQRRSVAEIRRLMRAAGRSREEQERIKPDRDFANQAGEYGDVEQEDTKRTWLLTKFFKEWDKDGGWRIKAVMVSGGVVVRPPWDIGIRRYPIDIFRWERRKNCIYGESEITYLIPNQIAINRMITASVWAVMMMGMPIMVVNGDVVQQPVTNEPGLVIRTIGGVDVTRNAIGYVNPPNFSPNFDNNISSLIANTLTQSGANDSALGDVNPENTSAIIAVREAATMPMQTVQNRFYSFMEDVARTWAEFFVMLYGDRHLRVDNDDGSYWYLPFDGKRYRELLINARIDVGASTLWSVSQSIRTLDNLFDRGIIDVFQYLQRLPRGTVPNVNGLIREMAKANQSAQSMGASNGGDLPSAGLTETEVVAGLTPEMQAVYQQVPEQARAALMKNAMAEGSATGWPA